MNEKFTVEKLNDLWKCKYENEEWIFQSLEDLCIFMEDYLNSIKDVKTKDFVNSLFSYNNDKSIN